MNVTLKLSRLSYPHLFVPQPPMEGSAPDALPKYNARFMVTEEDQAIVEAGINAILAEKFPTKVPAVFTDPAKRCLRQDPETKGWYVAASNVNQPRVIDRSRQDIAPNAGIPYAGCYVNAVVRLWVQDNKYGKRVNASLEAVQFVKDGERFGHAPVDVDEAFPDLGDDDIPF